jgi:hypothetical protein
MVFQSQPSYFHPDHHLLVGRDHRALCSVFHSFTENIVGIQVNVDHDVLVTLLRGYWEGARLVSVDSLCQFLYLYKDVIHPLDGNQLWR